MDDDAQLTPFPGRGPDGKVERWAVEGGAPNALIRRGWTKNSVPVGVEIIVEGFHAKDGAAPGERP